MTSPMGGPMISNVRSAPRILVLAVGATVLALALGFVAPIAQASSEEARTSSTSTYLALGDSLAAGYQPGRGETAGGYVNQLWRRLRTTDPDLRLRNLACSGETSRSLITGQNSPCSYDAGSQLDAAVAYLVDHPGEVDLITVDIGGNDLLGRCLRRGLIERSCVADLRPRLKARVREIVHALSDAAGSAVPIVAMTYYDPLLGLWGLVPGGRALARADQRAWTTFNTALTRVYENTGVHVADVAETFRIDDFENTLFVKGRGPLPANVALTCRWTWFCAKFDVHPNRTGYGKIAATFQREIRSHL